MGTPDFELNMIVGTEPPVDNLECPICDEIDEDGLEACADCYNSALADCAEAKDEAARMRAQRDAARAELMSAKESVENLKFEIMDLNSQL